MIGAREIGHAEFLADWHCAYERVFAPPDTRATYRESPFSDTGWKLVPIPATLFDGLAPVSWRIADKVLAVDEYAPLLATLRSLEGGEICIAGAGYRAVAPDRCAVESARFDAQYLHFRAFDRSASWGLAVIDDHLSLIGGDEIFMDLFLRNAGGEARLRGRFQDFDLSGGWWIRVEHDDWPDRRKALYDLVGWPVPPEPNRGYLDRPAEESEVEERWKPVKTRILPREARSG